RLLHRYAEQRLQRLQNVEQQLRMGDRRAAAQAQQTIRRDVKGGGGLLDLGIGLLPHAPGVPRPEKRRPGLEKTEKTLLEIPALAGRADDFLLSMGEVHYWLGRQAEAQKQFDEFLTAKGRSPEALREVARILRGVGAVTEARARAEEAYEKE